MPEENINPELEPILDEIQDEIDNLHDVISHIGFTPVPIELTEGMQLRVYCDWTWDAILTTNNHQHPTIYQKSGALVRIMKTGDGRRIIQPMDVGAIHNALTYRVSYFKQPSAADVAKYIKTFPEHTFDYLQHMEVISLPPPKDIVSNIFNRHSYEGLPELVSIVTCPIMDLQTGDINFQSHYDPVAQMYYGNTGLHIPCVPENPTLEDIQAAVAFLKETIVDFPFVNPVDRANALGCIITAVIRPSITGNIPIYIIDKPAPGTGAGLLCDTISLIVAGELARVMTLAREGDDAEWKKVITSVLRSGCLLSFIDNIEDKVDLPSLASLVTCGLYSDRILATNTMFTTPHRNVWILNGNNVQIGGDLGRRSYGSRMDALLKKPWLRAGFTHNQIPWVTANRGQILSAIYTIVRGWVRAGCIPADTNIPQMGSFEQWRNIIGGIMQFIGENEFMSNTEEFMENTDVDTQQWDSFINVLFDRVADWNPKDHTMLGSAYSVAAKKQEVTFTTRDVLEIMEFEKDPYRVGDKTPLVDLLPESIADAYTTGRNINKVIGQRMRSQLGRVFLNGLRLGKIEKKKDNMVRYTIQKLIPNNICVYT